MTVWSICYGLISSYSAHFHELTNLIFLFFVLSYLLYDLLMALSVERSILNEHSEFQLTNLILFFVFFVAWLITFL